MFRKLHFLPHRGGLACRVKINCSDMYSSSHRFFVATAVEKPEICSTLVLTHCESPFAPCVSRPNLVWCDAFSPRQPGRQAGRKAGRQVYTPNMAHMSMAHSASAALHKQQQQQQQEEEEEEEEEVSDNPLPAWMEGDSLAPPCQADMDVVRAIIDFAGVTEDDVSLVNCTAAAAAAAATKKFNVTSGVMFAAVGCVCTLRADRCSSWNPPRRLCLGILPLGHR